jgi:hypothetical protein
MDQFSVGMNQFKIRMSQRKGLGGYTQNDNRVSGDKIMYAGARMSAPVLKYRKG